MSAPRLVEQDMGPIAAADADRALASGDPAEISMALLRLSLHGPDWRRAEELALAHADHPDVWVRRNAATALGHVARVHGTLDRERSIPALERLLGDDAVHDWAEAALDDVRMYLEPARTPVASAALASIGYDGGTQTLEVEFRDGRVFRYLGVSPEEYSKLCRAESVGRSLHQHIDPHHTPRRVRKPRVTTVVPVRADRVAA